jgi:hypothetical protein
MNRMMYIGMGIILLSFFGLIDIVCIGGLAMSVSSDSHGMTRDAFKERLPTFLALVAFLVMLGLIGYAVVLIMRYYGA